MREADIHKDKNREHEHCKQCWPLEQESEHNQSESDILRMANLGVWTDNGEPVLFLRGIKNLPRIREQDKPIADKNVTHDMERSEVRVATPAKQVLKQMAGIMGKQINAGNLLREPTGEKINGQRKSVHLGEKRDDKRGERPERTPIQPGFWFRQAPREPNDEERSYDDEWPKAV